MWRRLHLKSDGRSATHTVTGFSILLVSSFSSSIIEIDLMSADKVSGHRVGVAEADTSRRSYWHCRYAATVSVQLHQRRGGARDTTLGFSEGEHADSSRGTARAESMKRAKQLALQEAFSGLVLVIDHVEGAAVVLLMMNYDCCVNGGPS